MTGDEHRPAGPSLLHRSRAHFGGARERSKELSWLMSGKLAMTAANAAVMLALSLWLIDIQSFGLFATVVGGQLLVSRVLLLGVDSGAIRLFTEPDGGKPEAVLRAALGSTLLLSCIALVGTVAISGMRPFGWNAPPLLALAVGAVGTALFDLGCAAQLARLHYRAAGLLQSSMPIARLVATVAVAWRSPENSYLILLVYAAVPMLFGAWLAWRMLATTRAPDAPLFGGLAPMLRLVSYSKWIGISDVAMMLGMHQGIFLLTFLRRPEEAGVYGFSLQLALGFFAIYLAFYQAILPRAARIGRIDRLPRFLARTYTVAGVLVVGSIPLAALLSLALPPLLERLNPQLLGFAPSFRYLAAFMLLLFLEAPLAVTCQYLLRPQIQLVALVIRAVLIGAFGLWLIPAGGATGAGLAQLCGGLAGFSALVFMVSYAVRSRRRDRACAAS